MKKKLLLELEVETEVSEDGKHLDTHITHPALMGSLYYVSSSEALRDMHLQYLSNLNGSATEGNPINGIIESGIKLASGISDLKEAFKK